MSDDEDMPTISKFISDFNLNSPSEIKIDTGKSCVINLGYSINIPCTGVDDLSLVMWFRVHPLLLTNFITVIVCKKVAPEGLQVRLLLYILHM